MATRLSETSSTLTTSLFEAAGLARVRLWPLLAAFLFGRLVSYSIYVGAASAAHDSLSHLFDKGLLSPQAIATQIIGIAVLMAIVFIDWPPIIDKGRGWWAARRGRPAPPPIRQTALNRATPGERAAATSASDPEPDRRFSSVTGLPVWTTDKRPCRYRAMPSPSTRQRPPPRR
jgi:hypothetical protein